MLLCLMHASAESKHTKEQRGNVLGIKRNKRVARKKFEREVDRHDFIALMTDIRCFEMQLVDFDARGAKLCSFLLESSHDLAARLGFL